jgi:hypothetical protein
MYILGRATPRFGQRFLWRMANKRFGGRGLAVRLPAAMYQRTWR